MVVFWSFENFAQLNTIAQFKAVIIMYNSNAHAHTHTHTEKICPCAELMTKS